MSFVNVAPQLVSTAAADAARIGSAINTANTAAAATTQVLAAAQDEVSTAIAALFGSHGQHYQAISAQVAAYQQRFVLALSQAGSTYAVAESAMHPPGKLRSTVLPPWVWSSSWSVMVGPAGSGDLTQHGRDSSWCTRDTHSQLPVKPRDAGISSRTRMSSRPAAAAGLRDVRYTSDRQSCVSADARTLATPNQPL